MFSPRLFWSTLLVAAIALAFVIIAGALLGIGFGLNELAPSVGKSPFGVGISEGGGPITGLAGWILVIQAQFSQAMTATLSLLKTNTGGAIWSL